MLSSGLKGTGYPCRRTSMSLKCAVGPSVTSLDDAVGGVDVVLVVDDDDDDAVAVRVVASFGMNALTLVELCGDTTARSHPLSRKWLTSIIVVRLTPLTGPKDSVQSRIFLPFRASGKTERSLCIPGA